MVLTASEIQKRRNEGSITIEPFNAEQVKSCSYAYRLNPIIREYVGHEDGKPKYQDIEIPATGYTLKPNQMYLGTTDEKIGSDCCAMSLVGLAACGKLGLFVQVDADLGHTTSCHRWTLEIVATRPTIVYPKMLFGLVSFYENKGVLKPDVMRYAKFDSPQESLSHNLKEA